MNERIEKLGQQADLLGEFTPTKIPGRYVGYITEEQILKFAELIVLEMCKELDKAQWDKGEDWICADGTRIIPQIKEHFGVEE